MITQTHRITLAPFYPPRAAVGSRERAIWGGGGGGVWWGAGLYSPPWQVLRVETGWESPWVSVRVCMGLGPRGRVVGTSIVGRSGIMGGVPAPSGIGMDRMISSEVRILHHWLSDIVIEFNVLGSEG